MYESIICKIRTESKIDQVILYFITNSLSKRFEEELSKKFLPILKISEKIYYEYKII